MSLKTIITMFVLGSSSLAVAQPTVRDHRDDRTFTITGGAQASFGFTTGSSYDQRFTDHRHDGSRFDSHRDHRSPWYRGSWNRGYERHSRFGGREVLLAPASQMSLTNDGHAYHAVDPHMGRLMSLELDGLSGAQYIDYLVLHLTNGTTQRLEVNARLNERHQRVTIDLGRRGAAVGAITVYGSSTTRTSLQITGIVR